MGTARQHAPSSRWAGLVRTSFDQVVCHDESAAERVEIGDVIAKAAVGVDRVRRSAAAIRQALGRLHAESELVDVLAIRGPRAATPAGEPPETAAASTARLDITR